MATPCNPVYFMFMRAKRLATIRILTEIICNNLAQYYPHHLIDRGKSQILDLPRKEKSFKVKL